MDYREETIAAIATPVGIGGIGIIKISGTHAKVIARKIFRSKRPIESFDGFHLCLGYIVDPKSNLPLDEVLLSVMHAPFSYTREDVVEINSHSGYAILSNILQIVLEAGARLAKPGEFSLRAFLNGRIDLTQAEAIIDLMNAKTDTSLRLAASQLTGGLGARTEEIRQEIISILAVMEASIDFPDEDLVTVSRLKLAEQIAKKALEPIKEFIAAHSQRRIWHEGIAVVIVGRVNAGKSSIFNRLSQEERALVTPIPGTTRDILEYTITIEGLPLRLIDTAGIRKIKGTVERKGVDLTKTKLALADLVLLVVDRSRPLNQHDTELLDKVGTRPTIVVVNKIDLPPKVTEKKIASAFPQLPWVSASALTGEGFNNLRKSISNKVLSQGIEVSATSIIPNLRHQMALTRAAEFLENARKNILDNFTLETVAADLSWARDALDEITGSKTNDEVLDNIFGRFCLGK